MIYDKLAKELERIEGIECVYADEMVPEDARCPYIQMGYERDYAGIYKKGITGDRLLIIDVWSDRIDKRSEVENIISNICIICSCLKIDGHNVALKSFDSKIMIDTTTNTPYLHGSVSVVFLYS